MKSRNNQQIHLSVIRADNRTDGKLFSLLAARLDLLAQAEQHSDDDKYGSLITAADSIEKEIAAWPARTKTGLAEKARLALEGMSMSYPPGTPEKEMDSDFLMARGALLDLLRLGDAATAPAAAAAA